MGSGALRSAAAVLVVTTLAAGTLIAIDGLRGPGRAPETAVAESQAFVRQPPAEPHYKQAGIDPIVVFPHGVPGATEYFPDRIEGCWEPLLWLPPPDHLLGPTAALPPHASLFCDSLEGLCQSALAPRWVPDAFGAVHYLESGEGAYRARTAHACALYDVAGHRVIVKVFAGRAAVMIEPPPLRPDAEVGSALVEAQRWVEPCEQHYPYEQADQSPPPGIVPFFASLRTEILAPAVRPASEEVWERRAKLVAMFHGGLGVSYVAPGLRHPGLRTDDRSEPTVSLWTNGEVVVVQIHGDPAATPLFQAVQPTVDVELPESKPGPVAALTTRNEWTDPEGALVPYRQQASHERLDVELDTGTSWRVRLRLPLQGEALTSALWLCVARDCVQGIASFGYDYAHVQYQLEHAETRSKAIEWLQSRRGRCVAAWERLETSQCPPSLGETCSEVLSSVEAASRLWEIALPEWSSVLSRPDDQAIDFAAVTAAIRGKAQQEGLAEVSIEQATRALEEAEERLDTGVDERGG